jgi:hypothetical protein
MYELCLRQAKDAHGYLYKIPVTFIYFEQNSDPSEFHSKFPPKPNLVKSRLLSLKFFYQAYRQKTSEVTLEFK